MGDTRLIHFGTRYGEPTACRASTCDSGLKDGLWANAWAWDGGRVDCRECLKLKPAEPTIPPSPSDRPTQQVAGGEGEASKWPREALRFIDAIRDGYGCGPDGVGGDGGHDDITDCWYCWATSLVDSFPRHLTEGAREEGRREGIAEGMKRATDAITAFIDGPFEYKGDWSKSLVTHRENVKDTQEAYGVDVAVSDACVDLIEAIQRGDHLQAGDTGASPGGRR